VIEKDTLTDAASLCVAPPKPNVSHGESCVELFKIRLARTDKGNASMIRKRTILSESLREDLLLTIMKDPVYLKRVAGINGG